MSQIRIILRSEQKLQPLWFDLAIRGEFTDCVIKTQQEAFKVHRNVLSSASALLYNFFSSRKSPKVIKTHFSINVVKGTLKLIYRGQIVVDAVSSDDVMKLVRLLELPVDVEEVEGSELESLEEPDGIRDDMSALHSTAHGSVAFEGNLSDIACDGSTLDVESTFKGSPPSRSPAVRRKRRSVIYSKLHPRRSRLRQSRGFGPQLSCRHCPLSTRFYNKRGLKIHENFCSFNVDSIELFTCDKCGKEFRTKSAISNHLIAKHLKVEPS